MGSADPFAHFLAAQSNGVYAAALREIRCGRKRTHWMWFVFPQVAGLGRSPTARRFSLSGLPDAAAYASHDLLGPRLIEATEAMLSRSGIDDAERILGPVDAVKFRSSMTLFELASRDPRPFARALDQFYDGARATA